MYSVLLAVIYTAFVSLGLPDAMLGAAWPAMRNELNIPISYAGIVSLIIALGTVFSSVQSDRITKKFGAGAVTAASVGMTALALFGFAFAGSFPAICLWAIPYGLGAGGVDAALNNYVALHYSSRHMSWLHCCWGVGAAAGPVIMGYALTAGQEGWHSGYMTVAIVQIILSALLWLTLPLWGMSKADSAAESLPPIPLAKVIRIPGVVYMLLAFFGYCGLESSAGLWASSYLAEYRHCTPETAANFAAFFYGGITAGRFLCGFFADKAGDRNMAKLGIAVIFAGIILIALPVGSTLPALAGLIVTGLGCAPVFPAFIHATPDNFGAENSQAVIGVQMASAYIGTMLMPPVFGIIARYVNIGLYPLFLFAMAAIIAVMLRLLKCR